MTRRFALAFAALAACGQEPPRAADETSDTGLTTVPADAETSSEGTSTSGAAADGSSTGAALVVIEIPPTDDTTADSEAPAMNFGGANRLEIENDENVQNAYLRFVVPPMDGEIVAASLRLLAVEGSDYGGDLFIVADDDPKMGMQWTEDTLTWNNAVPIIGDPISSFAAAPSATHVSFDVTGAVALGASHSFAITTSSVDEIEYSSKEGMEPPMLILTVMSP